MVQVVNSLAEYCRKNSISDGSYGMRSLIDWIISSEITGDIYESAIHTIISKATADEQDREALISAVLEPNDYYHRVHIYTLAIYGMDAKTRSTFVWWTIIYHLLLSMFHPFYDYLRPKVTEALSG